MAVDRGATVAGIDAAAALIEIAAERTPEGDFRVGDLEALPWPDASFEVTTGFNSFQFADDKKRALAEARRVSQGTVVVVIPSRPSESGIAHVFGPLAPLFAPEALATLKRSGIWSLSEPGTIEGLLAAAGLHVREDEEIDSRIAFGDVDTATRAFLGAGPTAMAIQHSGRKAVSRAVRDALDPFIAPTGSVTLPAWYRVVIAAG